MPISIAAVVVRGLASVYKLSSAEASSGHLYAWALVETSGITILAGVVLAIGGVYIIGMASWRREIKKGVPRSRRSMHQDGGTDC